jgi:hypothetical protein
MNDEIVTRYWNTYGYLDLEPGEMLDANDVRTSDNFTEEEIQILIQEGLVYEESN